MDELVGCPRCRRVAVQAGRWLLHPESGGPIRRRLGLSLAAAALLAGVLALQMLAMRGEVRWGVLALALSIAVAGLLLVDCLRGIPATWYTCPECKLTWWLPDLPDRPAECPECRSPRLATGWVLRDLRTGMQASLVGAVLAGLWALVCLSGSLWIAWGILKAQLLLKGIGASTWEGWLPVAAGVGLAALGVRQVYLYLRSTRRRYWLAQCMACGHTWAQWQGGKAVPAAADGQIPAAAPLAGVGGSQVAPAGVADQAPVRPLPLDAFDVLRDSLLQAATAPARAHAAERLGAARAPQALGALLQALDDPDGGVRAAAAKALGRLGRSEAAGILAQALGDVDERVRQAAREALDQIEAANQGY